MTMRTTTPAVHVVIKVARGTQADVRRFHVLCHECDPDWPYVGMIGQVNKFRECAICGGREYERPRLTPLDIKAAAKQCGVKAKVLVYRDKAKCFEDGVECYTFAHAVGIAND
jgi:hypothetical protein